MGDSANGAELKRVESYQWPSAHVGHLSEGQSGALDRFKKLCHQKGYYEPGNEQTAPTHDDETLLRYLRARKFVPQEAFAQFKDTEDWRKENQLDKLYETIDIHEYDQTRRLYPQWTGRRDKRGIPLYVFEIGKVEAKDVTANSSKKDGKKAPTNSKEPWRMLKLFALYENLCRFILPLCSAIPNRPNAETPISQSNNIVDLTGVGLGKLFNLRGHMSDASKLATAHYPETLDRIFVVGTPSYFPTIWGWAKSWFDPITVSKIFILGHKDMTSTLAKYVDMDNIPKKYGGKLDWEFGKLPNLEPEIVNSLKWQDGFEQNGRKQFPIGPIKWEYDEHGDLVATAIGTENGSLRRRKIAGLHSEPSVARLALSPGRVDNPKKPAAVISPTSQSQPAPTQESITATNGDSSMAQSTQAAQPEPSGGGTYAVYNRDDRIHPIADVASTGRTGTSSTRFQQQADTHADGQLAEGTPEVKIDSQGERQGVMDPNTVGQAPKDHPLPKPEEPQPTMIEQAKTYAGQAVEQVQHLPATVMSAVGMGGKAEESKETSTPKAEDPEIDNMPGKSVEEFLRSKTMSSKSTDGNAS